MSILYGGINRRNYLINGGFDIADYGTSQDASTDGYGSDNRWRNDYNGTVTRTHTQATHTLGQTDVPGNPKKYSVTTITVGGSGSSDYVRKSQRIEGVHNLSGERATLSLYFKEALFGKFAVSIKQHFGTGGSPSADVETYIGQSAASSGSFENFIFAIDVPSISGKDLGDDGNDYLEIIIWFSAGSDYNSLTGSLGFQTGSFQLSNVQLEDGPVNTAFEQLHEDQISALCLRHYYRIGSTTGRVGFAAGRISSGTAAVGTVNFYPPMMSVPVLSYSATDAIRIGDGGGSTDSTAISLTNTSMTGSLIICSAASLANTGGGTNLETNTNDWIAFESEL